MSQEKEFESLLQTALGGDASFASMVMEGSSATHSSPRETKAALKTPGVSKRPSKENVLALKKSQNEFRGKKGTPKGERILVAFKTPIAIFEAIDDLTYTLGKSKNILYNEALELIIEKYSK